MTNFYNVRLSEAALDSAIHALRDIGMVDTNRAADEIEAAWTAAGASDDGPRYLDTLDDPFPTYRNDD